MSMSMEEALRQVPESAPNRERLASLLVAVEEAASDMQIARWQNRLLAVTALLAVAQSAPKGSQEALQAREILRRAVNAAREYARVHGLTPNTRSGVRAEAHRLSALRQ